MIGSGDGLAPNKRQAIAWASHDPVHCNERVYVTPGHDVLRSQLISGNHGNHETSPGILNRVH